VAGALGMGIPAALAWARRRTRNRTGGLQRP
jgi:hypothetical protein